MTHEFVKQPDGSYIREEHGDDDARDKLTSLGFDDAGREILRDQFGGIFQRTPAGSIIEASSGQQQQAIANSQAPSGGGGATAGQQLAAGTSAANLAESQRQFDITSQQNVEQFNARQEQEAQQFVATLQNNQQQFVSNQTLIRDQHNAQVTFELEKLAKQTETDNLNRQFLIRKEENAVAEGNRTAQMQARRDIEAKESRIATNDLTRTQMAQAAVQFNAGLDADEARFNASMAFQVQQENARLRQENIDNLRANARDIAEFQQQPGDVGKLAAFLRAGGLGEIAVRAGLGESAITDESLAPLAGFLGAKTALEEGPSELTFDPISTERAALPEFADTDRNIPRVDELTGAPITFDTSGLGDVSGDVNREDLFLRARDDLPAADEPEAVTLDDPLPTVSPPVTLARRDNTFVTDPVDPETHEGPVTTGGTPIVPTAPGAAEPIVRDGVVTQIEPIVSPGVFTALKPSGQVDADLAEFDRRVVESGIDTTNPVTEQGIADMRAMLEQQSQERTGVVGLAEGGTTFNPLRLVGEEGPELQMDNPDGSTTTIPNPQTTDLVEQPTTDIFRERLGPETLSPGLFTEPTLTETPQLRTIFDDPQKQAFAQRAAEEDALNLRRFGGPTTSFTSEALTPGTRQIRPPEVQDQIDAAIGAQGGPVVLPTQPTPVRQPQAAATGGVSASPTAPVGIASIEETRAFQDQVIQDALRRGGFRSVTDIQPIKTSAPGTARFLKSLSQGVFSTAGFGDRSIFEDIQRRQQATGVRAGTSRRTA